MSEIRDALASELLELLVEQGELDIHGFGSWAVQTYKAYQGRNPRTGEPVDVAAKRLAMFRTEPALYDRLDGGTSKPIRCRAAVERVAKRLGRPVLSVTGELVEWLAELALAVGRSRLGQPIGTLGLLRMNEVPARPGHDPQTGAHITVPSRRVVVFRASRRLAKRLAGESPADFRGDVAPLLGDLAALTAVVGDALLTEADLRTVLGHVEQFATERELDLPF